MAEHVCPWWLGYWMASPIRKWIMADPEILLAPYVRAGMTVLEPGPGMGFFTLPIARLAGPEGRIVAIDIQPKMLKVLERRAQKAGLASRVETRIAKPDNLGIENLTGAVDFVLAFAVVHEFPSAAAFFAQAASALKPGGALFLAEPAGHVTDEKFRAELDAARDAGLRVVSEPTVRRARAAVFHRI